MGAIEAIPEAAIGVARAGALDFDDVGPKVREHHASTGPGDERALFDHADAVENAFHRTPLNCRPPRTRLGPARRIELRPPRRATCEIRSAARSPQANVR